ncbi:MAG: hypothetical protein IPJ40_02865 [Saprospirales bacterium]|nr:hypothetical protein [Saprospirales bacterium]
MEKEKKIKEKRWWYALWKAPSRRKYWHLHKQQAEAVAEEKSDFNV